MSSNAPRWMIVFSSAYLNTFVHIDFCYLQRFSGLVDKSTDKQQSKEDMNTYKTLTAMTNVTNLKRYLPGELRDYSVPDICLPT